MAQAMRIDTPNGTITVEEYGSYGEYPGITEFFNGEQVCTAEYSNTTENLQINVWQGDYINDPVSHFEYPDLARPQG